jgi:protein-L-isoaspartate O-methyltransferase
MKTEDCRQTSHDTWQALAPGWGRWRAQLTDALAPVRTWLIGELAPRPGDTVLELSDGVGDTGFAAAAIVGERGRLISSDFSAEMLEVARRRGAELGLGNVAYEGCSRTRASPPCARLTCRCAFPSATSTSTRHGSWR